MTTAPYGESHEGQPLYIERVIAMTREQIDRISDESWDQRIAEAISAGHSDFNQRQTENPQYPDHRRVFGEFLPLPRGVRARECRQLPEYRYNKAVLIYNSFFKQGDVSECETVLEVLRETADAAFVNLRLNAEFGRFHRNAVGDAIKANDERAEQIKYKQQELFQKHQDDEFRSWTWEA